MIGRTSKALVVIATALLAAAQANALTIHFDEYSNGDKVFSSQGVAITTTNFGVGPDFGVAFDSTLLTPTEDWDLRDIGGWDAGNLAPDTVLNRLLIIPDHGGDCSATNCPNPNDADIPGGLFVLDFSALGLFETFAFDLIDVEDTVTENGWVLFFRDGVQVGSRVFFDSFESLGQGVVFGDNSANRIDLGVRGPYNGVKIFLGGSGAIDNVNVGSPIPEPTTLALLGTGLVGLTAAGRKRR